jgi:hypothetical protein
MSGLGAGESGTPPVAVEDGAGAWGGRPEASCFMAFRLEVWQDVLSVV